MLSKSSQSVGVAPLRPQLRPRPILQSGVIGAYDVSQIGRHVSVHQRCGQHLMRVFERTLYLKRINNSMII